MPLKFKLDKEKGALLPVREHSTDAGADKISFCPGCGFKIMGVVNHGRD